MKGNVIATIVALVIIGGAFYYTTRSPEVASTDNVAIENGKQIVEITAKGRYSPTLTAAKANMPTIVRMETNGTFDCTSQLTVPSIGYKQILPSTGTTDIELPPQKVGASVRGICGMGMYNFEVKFN